MGEFTNSTKTECYRCDDSYKDEEGHACYEYESWNRVCGRWRDFDWHGVGYWAYEVPAASEGARDAAVTEWGGMEMSEQKAQGRGAARAKQGKKAKSEWKAKMDKKTGREFHINRLTKEVSWTRPEALGGVVGGFAESPPPASGGGNSVNK